MRGSEVGATIGVGEKGASTGSGTLWNSPCKVAVVSRESDTDRQRDRETERQ
jgi:hypothetical protein